MTPRAEPVHDLGRRRSRNLQAFFNPEAVAVIGASERAGSVGARILDNLQGGGSRRIFAVNPAHDRVRGVACFPTIGAVPDRVDLAIIATPAPTVPQLVEQCAAADVKAAIIISAGFREVGAAGRELEQRVLDAARGGMRIIGPNCLGVMSPAAQLNATFASGAAAPGSIAFLSQSGAVGTAILDWSRGQHFGFSRFVSTGSMLDVGWADLIDYLGDDHETKSIIIYMESVGDARAFVSAAREVALAKPIIIIKAGRSEAAAKAAASHTGALTGSDIVFDAAMERCGVMRVETIAELFLASQVLAQQPRPAGRRLAIITNAGGPAVLAADALVGGGGEIAPLSAASLTALDALLPPHWSHGDPVDVLGDSDAVRYGRALDIVAADEGADGVLAIYCPQGITPADDIARSVVDRAAIPGKPMLASWMGGESVMQGAAILESAGIPTFAYADTAAKIFNLMWRYDAALAALYETPAPLPESDAGIDRSRAAAIVDAAKLQGRTILTEAESKSLLASYAIPTVETRVCASAGEAVKAADALGYPVAVKLHSLTVTHKSDVGGVVLDVADAAGVRSAFASVAASVAQRAGREAFAGVTVQPMIRAGGYELIVGSSVDRDFGPVLLFGLGGTLVEVFQDRALGLPPLTASLARQLMERTKIMRALRGARGKPAVDLAALESALIRFAMLVLEQPRIKEIDINPLLASPEGVLALDARVVLHDPAVAESALPRPAIRPYPMQYVSEWTAPDGAIYHVRPIRPEDEPLVRGFHESLSESSVYSRYAHIVRLSDRISHAHLIRSCFIDYERQMALVVLPAGLDAPAIVAIGRLIKSHDDFKAEFALAVSDGYQGHGIGTELLRRLVAFGRAEGVRRIVGYILAQNSAMIGVCRELGFSVRYHERDPMATATLEI